jgi:hypothetical protein
MVYKALTGPTLRVSRNETGRSTSHFVNMTGLQRNVAAG